MGKFFLGLATGVVLVILFGVVAIFAIAAFRAKPPAISDGSTLVLHLAGDVSEKPSLDLPVNLPIPGLTSGESVTVESIWTMLQRAAADTRIKAVIFEPDAVSLGWGKMQEIHADLEAFRKSGKPLIAYLRAPATRDYYLATACSKIYMEPTDTLYLKGLGFETMYFKNTLDKLGVNVEIEHAGKYKDYGDMFTRSTMSPETREVLNSLADGLYGDLIDTLARGRGRTSAEMKAIIDDGPFIGKKAKEQRLVDGLVYENDVFNEVKATLHQDELKKVSERDYAGVTDAAAGLGTAKDKIAFIVGEGTISRGDPNSTPGDGLESVHFDRILDRVAKDDTIKGVIVRIDSPGGEVTASDEMWQAMNQLKKKKPLVVSMSDEAASGGYYMAMAGAPILAYSGTITGSIGVVFGKPNLHGLYDKVGVTKEEISRGRNALIDSDYVPLTPEGRAKLREGIDSDYQDFLDKVAASRKRPLRDIAAVAEGRVWLGDQAKNNGLVDELGGLDRAVQMIKQLSGIPAGNRVSLVRYPAQRTIWDYFFHSGAESTADAVVSRALLAHTGLEPLRAAWKDDRLRVWMHGGMLRMMPFSVTFR